MAQQNEQEKSTQDKVRKIVKEIVSSFISEIVRHYTKKLVIEGKEPFSDKSIRRIEERSTKDVLEGRLDTRLSETSNQVSNEIVKDGTTWMDIEKGIERALENGLKKYFQSISRLISLKTIVVSAIAVSVLGGGAISVAILFHTLTLNITGEGVVNPGLGAQRYAHGTDVTVSAQPAAGWKFDYWEGDVSSTSPTLTVTMDSNKDITACFTRVYGCILSINVVGSGSTDPPAGDLIYDAGGTANVKAIPATGWEFDRWVGCDNNNVNPTRVTMDSDRTVTAYFTEKEYRLSIRIDGNGNISPSGGTYKAGTAVTLDARPAAGWEFDRWSGTDNNNVDPTSVTMDSDKIVTAYFIEKEYRLSTRVDGNGSINPSSGTYDLGTRVNVNARPASGWEFDHWGGDATGTSPSITVTMTSGKNIIAYFTKIRYTLSASTSPSEGGNVNPSSGTYDAGTRVTVTAYSTNSAIWRFTNWGGDASGTNPSITVTMTSNKNITAYFTKFRYTLSTSVSPWGSGSVSPSSGTYDAGTQVKVTASPVSISGYKFDYWGGDASGTAPSIPVTMTSNKNITAYFTKFYSSNTQLLLGGSGINTIWNLNGGKIAVISGASWDCAVVALNTHGITYSRVYIPTSEIYVALMTGVIDAVLVAGHPSMFVPEDVNVLAWGNTAIQAVIDTYPEMVATFLEANTYSEQGSDIKGYAYP